MIRRPPRSTRTDTLFPYTTLFRSGVIGLQILPVNFRVAIVWVLNIGKNDGPRERIPTRPVGGDILLSEFHPNHTLKARLLIITLEDRKSVVWGKSVSVRVALGGRRIIKKKYVVQCRLVFRVYTRQHKVKTTI